MSADKSGPLAGVRVLELAGIGPIQLGCMLLADLGAEVVRIERPRGHVYGPPEREVAHRSRPSVVINLQTAAGAETVLRMAEAADVLIEAFRPGVAERLGVGPQACAQCNGALIYARMTGWGQQGPLAARAGHDINDTYECADGKYVAVGAMEPQFFGQLVTTLGLTGVPAQHDRAGWPTMRRMFEAAFLSRTRDDWADGVVRQPESAHIRERM